MNFLVHVTIWLSSLDINRMIFFTSSSSLKFRISVINLLKKRSLSALYNLQFTRNMKRERENMNDMSSLVADRIELARNTVYALMPTGTHGENGLSPVAIHKLIMTFVLPRMPHGLDSVILKQKDVQSLDSQYSKILRNLLFSLREKVAKEAVYLLFGLLPIETEIHVRVPTLYGAITSHH